MSTHISHAVRTLLESLSNAVTGSIRGSQRVRACVVVVLWAIFHIPLLTDDLPDWILAPHLTAYAWSAYRVIGVRLRDRQQRVCLSPDNLSTLHDTPLTV